MTDGEQTPTEQAKRLHQYLEATEQLPIERTANRWIGEAQAVAGDVASGDVTADVLRDRAGHVVHLLENVEDTGHSEADEHVRAALEIARNLVEEVE